MKFLCIRIIFAFIEKQDILEYKVGKLHLNYIFNSTITYVLVKATHLDF